MLLHHHTTIETLALILKNKSIRFSRLDQVNDLEENIYCNGVKIGKYAFASCWTSNKNESIPLWKMYTGNGIGVRITLDHDMFKRYDTVTGAFEEGQTLPLSPDSRFITPFEDFFSKKYMVLPVKEKEIEYILKKIEYVDDLKEKISNTVKVIQYPNNYRELNIQLQRVGLYKHSRWSFEDETRFVILIFPGKEYRTAKELAENYNRDLYNAWVNGEEPPITYYDMKLKEDAFENMVVTMSPSMPLAQRIIVEALLKRYAPHAVLKESSLENRVR